MSEISERERLAILEERQRIQVASQRILSILESNASESQKARCCEKELMAIAAALGTIGSYANSRSKKYLANTTDVIQFLMSFLNRNIVMPLILKEFCVRLNAMQLSVTRTEVGLLGEVGLDFGVLKGKLRAVRKKHG